MEYSIKHIYPLWSSWQLSAAAYKIVGLCVWSVCVWSVCVFGVCERNQDDGECSERINSGGFPVQLRRTFMEIIFRNGFLLKRGQIFLCFFLSLCFLLPSPRFTWNPGNLCTSPCDTSPRFPLSSLPPLLSSVSVPPSSPRPPVSLWFIKRWAV